MVVSVLTLEKILGLLPDIAQRIWPSERKWWHPVLRHSQEVLQEFYQNRKKVTPHQ